MLPKQRPLTRLLVRVTGCNHFISGVVRGHLSEAASGSWAKASAPHKEEVEATESVQPPPHHCSVPVDHSRIPSVAVFWLKVPSQCRGNAAGPALTGSLWGVFTLATRETYPPLEGGLDWRGYRRLRVFMVVWVPPGCLPPQAVPVGRGRCRVEVRGGVCLSLSPHGPP